MRRLFRKLMVKLMVKPTKARLAVEALEDRTVPAAFGLHETGASADGSLIADNQADPHFSGYRAITSDGFPIGPWVGNDSTSRWVVPTSSDSDGIASPGTYDYLQTVDVTGYDPASVTISGQWAADDSATILINGVATANAVGGFGSLASFTLSGFQAGANTVAFVVTNEGSSDSPTGLRVSGVRGSGMPTGHAAVAGVFGTGTGADGQRLAAGAADPHYALVASALGQLAPAVMVNQDAYPIGSWVANAAVSGWVAPPGASSVGAYAPVGTYVFETAFDLTGFDPATASLSGLWAADNQGSLSLNGGTAIPHTGSDPGSGFRGFLALDPFDLTSGFVAGINTLRFTVTNDPIAAGDATHSPAGLRVDGLTLTAKPLPTVSVSKEYDASESGFDDGGVANGSFTVTRTGDTAVALTAYVALTGTATDGADYSVSGATWDSVRNAYAVVIPAALGADDGTTASFSIIPVADDVPEPGGETVIAAVAADPKYTTGGGGLLAIKEIVLGALNAWPSAQPTPAAIGQSVEFQANATRGVFGSMGDDQGSYAYAWTFGDGSTSTEANPAHTYSVAGSYAATVVVTDTVAGGSVTKQVDVTVAEATVGLSALYYEVTSGDASVEVTINLSGAPTGSVAVSYSTADRTAVAGTDYVATTGTVVFLPGETTKTIAIPVTPAMTAGISVKAFNFTLSGPTGAALAAALSTTVFCAAPPVITTGERNGIDWSTLDPKAGTAAISVDSVKGENFFVKTRNGTVLTVFCALPAAKQTGPVPVGSKILYNCHGFSADSRDIVCRDGETRSFAIALSSSMRAYINAEYTYITSVVAIKKDVDDKKKRVVAVMWTGPRGTGGATHSFLPTSIVVVAGVIDNALSKCDSKDGYGDLDIGIPIDANSTREHESLGYYTLKPPS